MQLFKVLPAVVLLLSCVQPALAQDGASAVTEMFSSIPLDAVEPDRLFEVQYGNPESGALALLSATDDPKAARLYGTGRGLPPEIAELLLMQMKGAKALVGFDMTDIRESAAVTQQGLLITLYRFDPDIRDVVGPALDSLGYDRDDRSGMPIWARGADFAFDLANGNVANPFGGRLGRWGRVAVDRNVVAWSPAWAPIEAFAAGRTGMALHPQIAALIDVLDKPLEGNGVLIGARFMIDPNLRTGSPAVMTADMASGGDDMALLAVVMPPEHTAGDLSELVEWNWHNVPMRSVKGPDTFADHFGGAVEFSVIANSIPVLLIQITSQREDGVVNSSFMRAHNLVQMGDLEILLAPREP